MLTGLMDCRMDVARAGDFGSEPLGVDHERTEVVEDSELLFTLHGPVAFANEDLPVKLLLDWKFFADRRVAPGS